MATNAILSKMGTPVVFQESGGNVTFTLNDTVDLGNGQVSNQWDRGASPRPTTYLLDALRSLIYGGWDAAAIAKGFGAVALIGTISFSLAFTALRGRVSRSK